MTFENGGILKCFKEKYPNTVLIIDATELFINTPSSRELQSATWSEYKHHNTVKILVGISSTGHVTYISDCHPGGISDRDITKLYEKELFGKLWEGSLVMADKGFEIADLMPAGVDYQMPPMLQKGVQMNSKNHKLTVRIASARIHVERIIARAKSFAIIGGEVDMNMMPMINEVSKMCK
eukprot:Pgem_evm1s18182